MPNHRNPFLSIVEAVDPFVPRLCPAKRATVVDTTNDQDLLTQPRKFATDCWYASMRHGLAKSIYTNSCLGLGCNRGERVAPWEGSSIDLHLTFRVVENDG